MKSINEPSKKVVSFDSLPSLVYDLYHAVQELRKNIHEIKMNLEVKKNDDDEYITRQGMADRFKVDISTIDNWANRGLLKRHTIGDRVYFLKSEVELKSD